MTTAIATLTPTLTDLLASFGACEDAKDWASTQPDLESAWLCCERGDWLLWFATRLNIDRKLVVRAACQCARLSLHLVPAGENRPLEAIEIAEAWAQGKTSLDKVIDAANAAKAAARDAARDAYYAAYYADYYAARVAARAAANAANAANAATSDAAYAHAAYYANAARAAAAAYARDAAYAASADQVRETISFSVIRDAVQQL